MRRALVLHVIPALLALGCEKEAPPAATKQPEEPTPSQAALDPKIAAVASAAAAAAPRAEAPSEAGPPANGILTAEKANTEARRGEAPKITLGSSGTEPRAALRSFGANAPGKEEGAIQVLLQSDPNGAALPLDFDVSVSSSRAKGENKAAEPSAAPATEAGKTGGGPESPALDVVVTLKSAKLKLVQGAEADELNRKLALLEGTTLALTLVDGAPTADFVTNMPKGAAADYADVVSTLAEGLATLLVPYPKEPVGAGAFWMVTSRDTVMGLDVVSYRMVKVKSVTPREAELQVSAKRYVAGSHFDVPRVAAGGPLEIDGFEASAEGSLVIANGRLLPQQAQVNSSLSAMLKPNAVYQSQAGVRLSFGAPKRAK